MRCERQVVDPGRWRLWAGVATLCLPFTPHPARAADPQSYAVTFDTDGVRALEGAVRESAELVALRRTAPVSPFALILRARQDVERLGPVLESFGYYAAHIDITIQSRPLDDSGLAALLEALPAGREAAVHVRVTPGPLYHLREVVVDGQLPATADGVLELHSGEPAVASAALAARERLLTALQQQGYAFARIEVPIAWVDATEPVIDLHFPLDAGPQVKLGAIDVQGLMRTKPAIVRSRLRLEPGERYDPRKLDAARRDLLALGVFSGVSVRTASEPGPGQEVPVTFQVAERKLHAIRLSAEYSTDLGTNAGVTWLDRNLWGNAEQLSVTANAVNLGGKATRTLGYDMHVELLQPDPKRAERAFRYSVAAVKQSLQAYDVQAVSLGAQLEQRFSSWWTGTAGLTLRRADIVQQGQTYLYTLLSLPITARYDSTRQDNPLSDPLRGLRVNVTLTPAESLNAPRRTLVSTQGSVASYLPLSHGANEGRTVLALRALAGNIFGASQFSLPPDQRFYGGGSATVRGYRYQSIGPKFPGTTTPAGGTTVAAVTAELRQRIARSFGAAVFVDSGQVTTSKSPFKGTWNVGFGAGARYYTPIGPIRLDVAFPVNPDPEADRFQLYLGLGQAF